MAHFCWHSFGPGGHSPEQFAYSLQSPSLMQPSHTFSHGPLTAHPMQPNSASPHSPVLSHIDVPVPVEDTTATVTVTLEVTGPFVTVTGPDVELTKPVVLEPPAPPAPPA